ncbi:DUF5718 family protein [Vibrio sp. 10N.261.51.F12]|uniref:DUF5718 family protein n=1 Tax=Vibrio sp. 10N.261.51.F12 TaxID=3229679 RepID=UPI003553C7DA
MTDRKQIQMLNANAQPFSSQTLLQGSQPRQAPQCTLTGFGIAGNTAGHLNQTGEGDALANATQEDKPRALFPIYVPDASGAYLAINPYSSSRLELPSDKGAKVQMEPELVVRFAVDYDSSRNAGKTVCALSPVSMSVMNDATYRNRQVSKLAEKKNWGPASKGLAASAMEVGDFSASGELEHWRLCGFHCRADEWQLCGKDTAITEYTFFYAQLTSWIQRAIITQNVRNTQNTVSASRNYEVALHNIHDLLQGAGSPPEILVSVGAVRYTPYGETHVLADNDKTAVILYDSRKWQIEQIAQQLQTSTLSREQGLDVGIIALIQDVTVAAS